MVENAVRGALSEASKAIDERLDSFEKRLGGRVRNRLDAFIFFPCILLPLINTYKDRMSNRHRIRKLAKKWGCLPPRHVGRSLSAK